MITYRPWGKWAGGKGGLLDQIIPLLPARFNTYYEPFLGMGAMFFRLRSLGLLHHGAVLGDNNARLIATHQIIRDDVLELVKELAALSAGGKDARAYERMLLELNSGLEQRWVEDPGLFGPEARLFSTGRRLLSVEAAGRFIAVNRLGFNGLYRVNLSGECNTPYGKNPDIDIVRAPVLLSASRALLIAAICEGDFEEMVEEALPGDFVFFDPPYLPVSETSFTAYSLEFGLAQHQRLARTCEQLDRRGVLWMVASSDTPHVHDLYPGRRYVAVSARRAINRDADGRGAVREIMILNYTPGGWTPGGEQYANV